MSEQHILHRFQDTLAKAKASEDGGADDKTHPLFHADPHVKKAVHKALVATHKHVFDNPKDTDYASAKARHAAIVSLASPENE